LLVLFWMLGMIAVVIDRGAAKSRQTASLCIEY